MRDLNPFQKPGQWYKGAFHVHTTNSDGKLTPAQVVEAHREHGYHILAVTDHDVVTDLSSFDDGGFLTIPAVEIGYDRNAVGQSYHLVMVDVQRMVDLPRHTPIQTAIERWTGAASLIHLAHPYWSGMSVAEIFPLEGLVGLEIYNTSSETDLGKGLATVHWDDMLVRGKRWWGYAVDDVHWLSEEGRIYDAFGGWVWIKAEKLEREVVLRALRNGHFYSSSGPEIGDFCVENGVARLHCSEATTINFVGDTQWGFQRRAQPGRTITGAEYRLSGNERYLRAECIDAEGRMAWTNPIFL